MSGLSQLVGSTSGVAHLAEVSATGKLQVVDTAVGTALGGTLTVADSAVASALGGTLTVSDTAVASALGGTLTVADSAVASALGGTLTVSDTGVISALGGTLSVSAPAISATSAVQKNAVSVSDSSTESTTFLDVDSVRRMAVFGNVSDASAQIKVEVSRDNITYFESEEAMIYVNATGDFHKTIELDVRYVIFTYTNTSGVAQTLTLNTSFKA